jgi:hypothetical protein
MFEIGLIERQYGAAPVIARATKHSEARSGGVVRKARALSPIKRLCFGVCFNQSALEDQYSKSLSGCGRRRERASNQPV